MEAMQHADDEVQQHAGMDQQGQEDSGPIPLSILQVCAVGAWLTLLAGTVSAATVSVTVSRIHQTCRLSLPAHTL